MSANYLPDKARERMIDAYLNGATIDVVLVSDAYTPSKAHVYLSDLTNELTCTGYTRKTLAGATISVDTPNHLGKLTGTPPVWATLGPATGGPIVGYAVFAKHGTVDGDSVIIGIMDVGVQTNGGAFTLNPNATYSAFIWLA